MADNKPIGPHSWPPAHDDDYNNYWKNLPLTDSPIVAQQLNRMEQSMDALDYQVGELDASKAEQDAFAPSIANIQLIEGTGTFRITRNNGITYDLDTDLEKIATNWDYDDDPTSAHYQSLIITLEDGTIKYVDLSALITEFEFVDSSTIHFTVANDGSVSASIINGSVTEAMLQTNFLADCRAAKAGAEAAETQAGLYATAASDSADDADAARDDAQDILDEVMIAVGQVIFSVDFSTGDLMYTDDTAYTFNINTTNGNLEWGVVTV